MVASHNTGKVREIGALLRPFGIDAVSAGDLGLPEPEETGATFEENAELKARAAATRAKLPALADDSGLCVDALDGAPGIYSARWAGPDRNFKRAMLAVEAQCKANGAERPHAYFVCVLSIAWPDGSATSFRGEAHGRLVFPGRGVRGFGYDPIFLPDGRGATYGEMDPDLKHSISHRADAFRKLTAAFA
ncbi:MAG: RdgB/HAM1 family non-canonical purine NTP pyrophosphatase [Pseudomonadota bacterium]